MYIVIWKYKVKRDFAQVFEKQYGAKGVWVKFFEKADGYLTTELLKDINEQSVYLTIDKWNTKKEYECFREKKSIEYKIIDSLCEKMTDNESKIGEYHFL